MRSNIFFAVCFLLMLPFSAFAQDEGLTAEPPSTAARIEALLEAEAVTYGLAAQFVLEAANITGYVPETAAFSFAEEKRWLPKNTAASAAARLDGIALLVMQSFNVKGGMMFSIFKNPHYAYRELVYRDVIQGRTSPNMDVSGDALLFMINRLLYSLEQDYIQAAEITDEYELTTQEILAQEIAASIEALNIADTEVRIAEEGITIAISDIQFLADSAVLVEHELAKLIEISRILETVPARYLLVSGHTALAGTEEGRMRISQERAEAVRAFLISLGTRRADEISAVGYGSNRPIADNTTPEGMAMNRRVEITILEQ